MSGRQKTRPRAALLHWLAIGSWDRNSICLGLRGPTAQHRPGNRTPLGELEEFIVWPLPPCPSIAWDSLGHPVPPGISIWVWFGVGVCFHSGQSDPNPAPNPHLTPAFSGVVSYVCDTVSLLCHILPSILGFSLCSKLFFIIFHPVSA